MPSIQSPLLAPAIRHYKAGRLEQAEPLLRRLVQKGQAPEAPLMLAKVLLDQGKIEPALFEVEKQLKRLPGDSPAAIELRLVLISPLANRGRREDVDRLFAEIEKIDPGHVEALTTRGVIELDRGRPVAAEEFLRRALAKRPSDATAALWLAQALGQQLRLSEGIALLRENLREYPGRASVQQVLAFLVHNDSSISPEEVLREQRVAASLCARGADALPPRLGITPEAERRLTIALVSPDLRQHSCSYFVESLLRHRERERLRIIALDVGRHSDEVTSRLKSLADGWRSMGRADDADLAAQIAADRVDIAIDLAGHTSGARLGALALRPAPIGATYLGYPGTTGVRAGAGIDYRIVDERTDPEGSEHLATEELLRIPGCFVCYTPPRDAPEVVPLPSAGGGPVTFGSFNAITKLSEATLDLWAGVLRAVPESRLMVKAKPLGDPAVAQRLIESLARRGINAGRVTAVSWSEGVRGHLESYGQIDIALDTTPYNGTTTTCEALWMGVPVVTLEGGMHAARVGVSLLHAAGLPELIAPDSAGFARICAELVSDRARLSAMRGSLRGRMARSVLCDGAAHAAAFERALRGIWRRWCAGQKK